MPWSEERRKALDEMIAIEQQREMYVVKSNTLIQQTHFSLSLLQQKIILYLVSKITPYDTDFKELEFKITEFCRVCGVDSRSGDKYRELKEQIKSISDKSQWIDTAPGKHTLIRWINEPEINDNSGTIKVKIQDAMRPYLLQLRDNYTSYQLLYILCLKSKYSVNLYEVVKSIHFRDNEEYSRIFSIDELRLLCDAEKYNKFYDLKRRVLLPAIEEINHYTDKILAFEEIKSGKKVSAIKIIVRSKPKEEQEEVKASIETELGYPQIMFSEW